MHAERRVGLFRNGRNEAVRIARELELPGKEAILRAEGRRRLIFERVARRSLLAVLAALKPLDLDLPVAESLPAEPVEF